VAGYRGDRGEDDQLLLTIRSNQIARDLRAGLPFDVLPPRADPQEARYLAGTLIAEVPDLGVARPSPDDEQGTGPAGA
jgi:hypothetical protein